MNNLMFKDNNLFQFATNELTQDAMICWICNNFNYSGENKSLYNLAYLVVVRKFLGLHSLEINQPIKIIRQFHKIDVLIVVNNKYAIIIEDKTYGSEAKNQINRYKYILINDVTEKEYNLHGLPRFQEKDIKTVYFKTGFHYPLDEAVKADCKITGKEWFDLLYPYKNESKILEDYLDYLKSTLRFYADIENSYKKGEVASVLSTHYGQFLFLKDMFDIFYSFSHGSSSGRPWSNHKIASIHYKIDDEGNSIDDEYTIFCRIDKKLEGFYASIRQYDKFTKGGSNRKKRKKEDFEKLRKIFDQTCKKITKLEDNNNHHFKLGGNNGNYYESEFGYFILGNDEEENTISEFPEFFKKFIIEFKLEIDKQF